MNKKIVRAIIIAIVTIAAAVSAGYAVYYYTFLFPKDVKTYLDPRSSDDQRNQAMWGMIDVGIIERVPIWVFLRGQYDSSPLVRRRVAEALPRISCNDRLLKFFLRKGLKDPDLYVQFEALDSAITLAHRVPDLAPDVRQFLHAGDDSVGKAFDFLLEANKAEPQDYAIAEQLVQSGNYTLAFAGQKFLRANPGHAAKNQQLLSEYDKNAASLQMGYAKQRFDSLRQESDLRMRIHYIDEYLKQTYHPSTPLADINATITSLQALRQETLVAMREAKEKERESTPMISNEKITPLELWQRLEPGKLLSSITLLELTQMAHIPVFLSGPHIKVFDRDYLLDFGHYNPAFIAWAKKALFPHDWDYFETTRAIYLRLLQFPMRYLLTARYVLLAHPELLDEYRSKYKAAIASGTPFVPYRALGGYRSELGADPTYLAYWVRRDMDGTASAVQELLEMITDAYDPDLCLELKQKPQKSPYALTRLGQYHGFEVNFEDGDKVFVLTQDDNGAAKLASDIVAIEKTYDAIADEEGQASGKIVSLKSGVDKGVILRGPFTAGNLISVSIPPLEECREGGCKITVGKKTYTIRVLKMEEVNVDSSELVKLYSLEVSDGSSKRFLPTVRNILWSGDLDRDGKLDLLFNDAAHYNVGEQLHLYLSSPAKHFPFNQVALFRSVGC